jgi:hypothetical protein
LGESRTVAATVTDAPSRTVRAGARSEAEEDSTQAPVIAGRSGLIPHATQPEGETKEPVNAASYVHASAAPCVGSAMHLP